MVTNGVPMSSSEAPSRGLRGSTALLPSAAEARPERRASECSICYEAYQEAAGSRGPKLLQCCHSVCLACLTKLLCPSPAFPFVVCPFCRRVTVMPEGGLQSLKDDDVSTGPTHGVVGVATDAQEEPGVRKGHPGASWRYPGHAVLPLEWNPSPSGPVCAVSTFVPEYSRLLHSVMGIWGMSHLHEVRTTVVVELPSRTPSQDRGTPKSVENLRLVFAVTLLLLIITVFFILVFLK